ncbi:MAG: ABC transporter ATP-binding protein [Halanaeroarchaeum sp.]
MTVLSIDDLTVSYEEVMALQGISLEVAESDLVGVIGPNGAGKSTLANTISGFLEYEGVIEYRGEEIGDWSITELVESGVIHCTETRDLFGHLSVEENLRLGAYKHGENEDKRLEYVYDLFPSLADRTGQNARTMSGGEQQMLAIGRALMGDPDLLILDEPTLGLAPVILEDIAEALDQIRDRGVTVLLTEQNVTFAMEHADYVYLLENGRVEREGNPEMLHDDEYIRDVYLGR